MADFYTERRVWFCGVSVFGLLISLLEMGVLSVFSVLICFMRCLRSEDGSYTQCDCILLLAADIHPKQISYPTEIPVGTRCLILLTGDAFCSYLVGGLLTSQHVCFIHCILRHATRNNLIISDLLRVLPPRFLGGE